MSHHPVPNLPPYPNQLGIFPAFLAKKPEALILKEKVFSFSGDNFSIKTLDGAVLFVVDGKAMSMSGRKIFKDAQGREMFHLKKELIALHATFYGEDPSNKNRLFQVKSKFSFGSSKAVCTFTSISGKPETLIMKGDFFDSSAEIRDESSGQVVALIDRKFFNSRDFFGGKQTYVVTAAPNVDMALVAAMCICLDEKQNEGN